MLEVNKKINELTAHIDLIEKLLVLDSEPFILVHDKVWPGTIINIRKSKLSIDKIITNVRFKESEVDKTIQFTSAS